MKKLVLGLLFLSLSIQSASAIQPLCFEDGRVCVIGRYTISSNSSEPLNIYDGIVCTQDNRICTNGFNMYSTNKTIYHRDYKKR